jgi:hypothetical protein
VTRRIAIQFGSAKKGGRAMKVVLVREERVRRVAGRVGGRECRKG